MPANVRRTGVDEARREEIHEFLKGRFTQYHDEAKEIYAQARRANSVVHVGSLSNLTKVSPSGVVLSYSV